MTVNDLLTAYNENRDDVFILQDAAENELCRISMADYFGDRGTQYGERTISQFVVDAKSPYCLWFTITLDD